ncbi:MAG: hypothetical protein ACRDYZ_09115 [Acidimicrobiales bacterium]
MPLHTPGGPEVRPDAEILVKCGRHGNETPIGEGSITDFASTIADLEEFCRVARTQGADDHTSVDGSVGGLSVRVRRQVAPLG